MLAKNGTFVESSRTNTKMKLSPVVTGKASKVRKVLRFLLYFLALPVHFYL